jgi:single-stranded-DNA-specific exonuclease
VGALRELDADCDWYIPDRMGDGYGLTLGSVERLAARGSELVISVDCGIGSVDEVAAAAAAGVEVVVTDHHQPGPALPDCPVLHPGLGGYPYPDLCGTGVAFKLAQALHGSEREVDLDLVALATVADMVPLRGENRALVRRGLPVARRALRPGLRALCAVASVDPARLDEGDFAFRLGPRINAAGRLYRADSAVELMLTADAARAREIAAELDAANRERRETERAVLDDAERARRELDQGLEAPPALVLAGQGWHPGVVGIVASRMVERHGVPAVLIGIGDDGRGRGSARSVAGFDLIAALDACSRHLARYGGHRAAAGLEIEAGAVDAFRSDFIAQVAKALGSEPALEAEPIDAVVGGESLGLDVAEQFGRLAPFGVGNPGVRLLVPAARLADVRPMGEGERHARFTLASGARRALGVAFGVDGALDAAAQAEEPMDVSLRLEVNEWNGAVEPRVVLGKLYASRDPGSDPSQRTEPTGLDDAEWWTRFEAELARPLEDLAAGEALAQADRREIVDRRGASGVAAVAAVASAGGPLLVFACDALRRRALVELAAPPERFGGGALALASQRLPATAAAGALDDLRATGRGVALADWSMLGSEPALASGFEHVLAIDPPCSPTLNAIASSAAGDGGGFLHLAWGAAEVALATRVHEAEWPSRAVLGAAFRALREAAGDGICGAAEARAALAGPGPFARGPETAARCLRVLEELELVRLDGEPAGRSLRVVSSVATELERSGAFVAYRGLCEEGTRYLRGLGQAS